VVGGSDFEIYEVKGDGAIAEEYGEEEIVDVEDDEEECVCVLPWILEQVVDVGLAVVYLHYTLTNYMIIYRATGTSLRHPPIS
jgi:hypothetical protein